MNLREKLFQSEDFKNLKKILKESLDSNKKMSDNFKSQTDKLINDIGKSIKQSMTQDYSNIKTTEDAVKFLKTYNLKNTEDILSVAKDLNEELNLSVHQIGEMGINFRKALKEQKELKEFTDKYDLSSSMGIEEFLLDLGKISDNKEACDKMVKNFNKALQEMEKDTEKSTEKISDHFSDTVNMLQLVLQSRILGSLDNQATSLLESGNSLIKSAGINDITEDNYRNFVKDVTEGLNKDTDNKYNLNDLYSDIAALAETTSINRIETLKEITRPAMLAYKSMNVSLDTIANLSGKLYEFSGVNSLKMEGLVDYVRTISKNMNVDEQKIINNMNTLADTVLAFSNKYDLSADDQLAVFESISRVSTQAESSGIDSSIFFSDLKEFLDNPYGSKLGQRLGILGINDGNIQKTLNDILSGNIDSIFNQYTKGIAEQVEKSLGGLGSQYLNTATLAETDYAYSIYNALKTGVMDDRVKEIYDNLKNPTTAAESVEDQFISFKDSISNSLSTQITLLTEIKEKIGIGFDDVITAIPIYSTAKGIFGKFFKGSKAATAAAEGVATATAAAKGSSAAKVGSTASKALGTVGKAVPFATLLAGLAVTLKGDSTRYEDIWLKDLNQGIIKGYENDDLYNYMLENSSIGTNITVDPKTGKALTGDEREKLALDQFNKWYENITSGLEAASSENFMNSFYEALEKQVANNNKIDEKFLQETFDKLGVSSVMTQDNLASILNSMFSGDYSTPFIFSGSYADKSIDKFIKENMPSYDVGTNYIDKDQLSLVHEGEAIVPKEYNPAANITELEILRNQSKANKNQEDENVSKMVATLTDMLDTVEDILNTFKEYSGNVDKRYNDDKLENKINASKIKLKSKITGISPTFI